MVVWCSRIYFTFGIHRSDEYVENYWGYCVFCVEIITLFHSRTHTHIHILNILWRLTKMLPTFDTNSSIIWYHTWARWINVVGMGLPWERWKIGRIKDNSVGSCIACILWFFSSPKYGKFNVNARRIEQLKLKSILNVLTAYTHMHQSMYKFSS